MPTGVTDTSSTPVLSTSASHELVTSPGPEGINVDKVGTSCSDENPLNYAETAVEMTTCWWRCVWSTADPTGRFTVCGPPRFADPQHAVAGDKSLGDELPLQGLVRCRRRQRRCDAHVSWPALGDRSDCAARNAEKSSGRRPP